MLYVCLPVYVCAVRQVTKLCPYSSAWALSKTAQVQAFVNVHDPMVTPRSTALLLAGALEPQPAPLDVRGTSKIPIR